jgi:predicted TIM-barrel fold metal-dependent hydrolase
MGAAMVIDFHTHILPPDFQARWDELRSSDATFAALFQRDRETRHRPGDMATAEDLTAAMDEDGVATSIVVGYGWCDAGIARESNDYLLDAATRYPGRILPFCSVHPGWDDEALAEVERCVNAGAVGIGELHPTSQQLDLATDAHVAELMGHAERLGLPVLVHGSEPVGHAYPGKGDTVPERLLAFIQRFPANTIICAHWGGGLPFYALMPEVRDALANVYFDSAASPLLYAPEVFPAVAKAAGAAGMLFGSDFPLVRASRAMKQVRDTLSAEDAEAVLHGNAARLLGRALSREGRG